MSLSLGSLKSKAMSRLKTEVNSRIGHKQKPEQQKKVLTKTPEEQKIKPSEKKKTKINNDCLKNKTTGKGVSGNDKSKGGIAKLSCEPIISKEEIKKALGTKDKFNYIDKNNKEKEKELIDGAYDKLNSNTMSAAQRSAITKHSKINCNINTGLHLPSFDLPDFNLGSFNMPSFDLSGFDLSGFNLGGGDFSLLNSFSFGSGGSGSFFGALDFGFGSAISDILSCGASVVDATISTLGTMPHLGNDKATSGVMDKIVGSGKLDLSTSNSLSKLIPGASDVSDKAIKTSPVKKINMSNMASDKETNNILDKLKGIRSIQDLKGNSSILKTALKSSMSDELLTKAVNKTSLSPAKKITVLSKVKTAKMKLVA